MQRLLIDESFVMFWKRPETIYHAHFDCFSGAAGDMLLASCLDAFDDDDDSLLSYLTYCLKHVLHQDELIAISKQTVHRSKGRIAATYVTVESIYEHRPASVPNDTTTIVHPTHDHHHHEHCSHDHHNQLIHDHQHEAEHDHSHQSTTATGPIRNLPEIKRMILEAPEELLPKSVKETCIQVFTKLAIAEAKVHGATSLETVHFHEVGAVDSIVDIVGTVLALHCMNIQSASCSALPLSQGTVRTAHGILPVPAPATLQLMVGLPVSAGPSGATGELVTPTAAALLMTICQTFGRPPPLMTLQKIGVGAGSKDFPNHPNILRLLLGVVVVDTSPNKDPQQAFVN